MNFIKHYENANQFSQTRRGGRQGEREAVKTQYILRTGQSTGGMDTDI